ncbi:MAG: glycosyltransferase family 4 protein [Candidatus Paceibacterota bacterium]
MERKKKIILVATKGDEGGAQKYVKQLAKGIDKNRFEPIIVSGNYGEALEAKIKVKNLGNKSGFLFYKDILAFFELFKIFKKERPDVVHLNSSKAGVIGTIAAKAAGVKKVIFTAHGWVFSDGTLSFLKRFFYIYLHRIAGFFQDAIINVSEYDRQLALKYKIAPEKKLKTILNGLDTSYFRKNFYSKEEARKKIESIISNDEFLIPIKNEFSTGQVSNQLKNLDNQDEIWVGTIGRLVKEKNYQLLVKAADKIKEMDSRRAFRQAGFRPPRQAFGETDGNDRKVKFFIIGDGYEKESLKLKVKSLKLEEEVFLLGEIGNAYKLMKAFNLFVLPSKKEGLPYTLIEAMIAGAPVLTSKTGGMTEIVEDGRGWLFRSGNENDLAEKIEEILNNKEEAKKRAEKAEKFAEENLNEERMIRETEKIYTENFPLNKFNEAS